MSCHRLPHLLAAALFAASVALPALAETPPASGTTTTSPALPAKPPETVRADAGDCPPVAAQAEPATPPTASADGTAPGNSGSTGWSGGAGGSLIGTNPSGATRHTKTWHAPTARGLDLKGRPEPAPVC
ncbi:hypothetical protein RM190_13330 [Paracoccus sp. CPCC 101403]|uniref:Uncharacterized protein n=1 Tax=Paracoccus broussonetiae TaxID=3075834 RepID=A0ABU3EHD9_9RHOB|nr:hypothetical protein [Paracoccus sp. CPCC 101403]MDT1062855.1 hypothetical protein [Paracoccus sp. CPCC 101403]